MEKTAATGLASDARGLRVVVLAAAYNEAIVAGLLQGALQRWQALGGEAERLRVERVPGAFELPLAARQFALSHTVDAIVALGCVIRGATAHFDYVAGECARGLQNAMLETGVPVAFGVLATENEAQALERSAVGPHNKGAEALETAVAMAQLLRRI
jgi:6,7-dimethyl-8-ribityllumazine synthase